MSRGVCISGVGIISAIGKTIEENLYALANSKTGIKPIAYLESIHKNKFIAGEVKESNQDLLKILGLSDKDLKNHTRTSLLGTWAAREAIKSANLSAKELENLAFISASTVGGMDKTEAFYAKKNITQNDYILTHPCGDTSNKIAHYLGIKGYRTTLSTACSSAANAIIHGARLIENGLAEIVVAGGVDALSKFTLNGFNSLMILDEKLCKPFDANRKGLNIGEGAGFIVLESETSLKNRNKQAIAKLSGYANANDAYHQTASSAEGKGATLAMKKALAKANITAEQLSYINAHGTGTENNDLSESVALKNIFSKKIPPFSSTKTFTGHTLGAAAAIEAIFSIMAIRENCIFPNLNFSAPIKETGLIPERNFSTDIRIKHVLSNSFGFGGNNSTLIFSAV